MALAELLTTRDKLRRARVHALVAGLGPDAIIPVDRTVAEIAGALRANNRSIRTPDALIAACAIAVGADTLLTTDRRLARLDGVEYVGSRRS